MYNPVLNSNWYRYNPRRANMVLLLAIYIPLTLAQHQPTNAHDKCIHTTTTTTHDHDVTTFATVVTSAQTNQERRT